MADFNAQIAESQKQVAEAQTKISAITGRIEAARAKLAAGETAIDIENATLADVQKHSDLISHHLFTLYNGKRLDLVYWINFITFYLLFVDLYA